MIFEAELSGNLFYPLRDALARCSVPFPDARCPMPGGGMRRHGIIYQPSRRLGKGRSPFFKSVTPWMPGADANPAGHGHHPDLSRTQGPRPDPGQEMRMSAPNPTRAYA
jgi:hypothetical protein